MEEVIVASEEEVELAHSGLISPKEQESIAEVIVASEEEVELAHSGLISPKAQAVGVEVAHSGLISPKAQRSVKVSHSGLISPKEQESMAEVIVASEEEGEPAHAEGEAAL